MIVDDVGAAAVIVVLAVVVVRCSNTLLYLSECVAHWAFGVWSRAWSCDIRNVFVFHIAFRIVCAIHVRVEARTVHVMRCRVFVFDMLFFLGSLFDFLLVHVRFLAA